MNNFDGYANYYDIIYGLKDYNKEALYVYERSNYFNKGRYLLDVATGTGNYAFEFEDLGFEVQGIDLSKDMITIAKQKKIIKKSKINFMQSDMITYKSKRKFDQISCLFHGINYLVRDNDLKKFFKNANKNLNDNGILFFDTWNYTKIINKKKKKVLNDKDILIERISQTSKKRNRLYNVEIIIKIVDKVRMINLLKKEVHKIRALTFFEVEKLSKNYFEIVEAKKWLSNTNLSNKDSSAFYILRKKL